MERKLGEIFEYNGEWYQCIIAIHGCDGCSFRRPNCCVSEVECFANQRTDRKSVIFKKLEKVGEPYVADSKCCQQYQCYTTPLHNRDIIYTFSDDIVVLEIKNKKDMEEKKIKLTKEEYDYIKKQIGIVILPGNIADDVDDDKLVNEIMDMFSIDTEHSNSEKIGKDLKPFNLEAAKAGKPVCTRDGRKARIICFDYKSSDDYSMIALIDINDNEIPYKYTKEGKFNPNCTDAYDLMMLPEKKEGWINVYKTNCGIKFSEQPYSTREEAIKNAAMLGRIDTIKVEWEE